MKKGEAPQGERAALPGRSSSAPRNAPPPLDWLTPEIEEAQADHRARVAALYADPTTGPLYIAGPTCGRWHGLWGTNQIDMLQQPDAWLADLLADLAAHAEEFADRRTFRPLFMEVDPLGVHYVDALFGAHVYIYEEQTWSDELPGDVADLAPPDLARSPIFLQSLELARKAVALSQGRILITTPVLSCPINIAINLFGQRFLETLIERPAVARRALRIITDVIAACTRAFMEVIPAPIRRNSVAGSRYAPPGFGQIDGCATQLVSGAQYREFFAPLDAELLALNPHGGMIHLCGEHGQHIAIWRQMAALRSVQLNDRATEDVELYFCGLRSDQILYVAPTAATPAERILDLTRGQRLVLQCSAP